ncbi:MAG: hypothetical protein R3F61_19220 [Myxococcota bacterium]
MMLTLLILFVHPALAQSEAAAPTVTPAAPPVAVQTTQRWELLLEAGRYDELAALSRDVLLTRRLSELQRARFMQQRLHAQYQPRHPNREAIDDRVRLLEGAVAAAACDLVTRARTPSVPAVHTDVLASGLQSGVSQGEPEVGAGAGAGAGAL